MLKRNTTRATFSFSVQLKSFKMVLNLSLWIRPDSQASGIVFRLFNPHFVIDRALFQLLLQGLELFLILGLKHHFVHVVQVLEVGLGVWVIIEQVDDGRGGVASLRDQCSQVPALLLQQIATNHYILNDSRSHVVDIFYTFHAK